MNHPFRASSLRLAAAALAVLAWAVLLCPAPGRGAADPPKVTPEQQARLDEAKKLGSNARSLRDKGKLDDAAEALQKKAAIERDVLGPADRTLADTLEQLARVQEERNDFDAAAKVWKDVIEVKTAALGEKHWQLTDARLAAAHAERVAAMDKDQRGRVAEALRLNREAEKAYRGTVDKPGDYPKALELAQQAYQIRKEVLPENDPDYAVSLNNLGVIRKAMADYAGAAGPLQEALRIRRKALGEAHPAYAVNLNNLGLVWQAAGQYARAEPVLRQARDTLEKLLDPSDPMVAASVNNLAVLYMSMGDYDQAEALCRKALDLSRKAAGRPAPKQVIDTSWQDLADVATAEYYWSLAYKPISVPPADPRLLQARYLNNLGLMSLARGDAAAARPLFADAVQLTREAAKDSQQYGTMLNNQAMACVVDGDFEAAEPLLREAVASRAKSLGTQHALYANSLSNLGLLYLVMGKPDEAEKRLTEALAVREKIGKRHPSYAVSLDNLAVLAEFRGDPDKAADLLKQALDVARFNVRMAAAVQSERQQLATAQALRGLLDHYLSLTEGKKAAAPDAYRETLAWKGAVFARQRRQRADRIVLAGANPKAAALYAEWDAIARQVAGLSLAVPDAGFEKARIRDRVAELTKKQEQLERDLAAASDDFRRLRETDEGPPTAEAVKKLLPEGVVLVDYLEYAHIAPPDGKGKPKTERRLTAFVVAADRDVKRIDLGPAAAVEKAVDGWREAWGRALPGHESPGARLRALVWAPLQDELKGAKTVLISPDGALGKLPFAALPGANPKTYLVEEVAIGVVPAPQFLPELMAAGDAKSKEPPDGAKPALLVVGDVDFAAAPGAAAEGGGATAPRGAGGKPLAEWPSLKWTGAEIDAVKGAYQKRFADGTVAALRGKEATEEKFRAEAPNCRWLHVATHGFFAPPELRSALAGADGAAQPGAEGDLFGRRGVSGFHPGLLSGVVLAGANRPPEPGQDDGVLTASEAAVLDLRRAELVVLSACETGLGEEAGGEGVLGLQRAFQVAGARTVVASLWQVPDEPTRILMERFYSNLWSGQKSKAEALREAQLWMLREGRKDDGVARGVKRRDDKDDADPGDGRLPPYYWAAFVLSGDWR